MSSPQFVRHPLKTEWGPGVIVDENQKYATVVFEQRIGEIRLSKKHVDLDELTDGDISPNSRLRFRRDPSRTTTQKPYTFQMMLERFIEVYPGVFADPTYESVAKSFTPETAKSVVEFLSAEKLSALIEAGKFEDVYQLARDAGSMTGLVHKYELVKLGGFPTDAFEDFANALFNLLHGSGDFGARFDALAEALARGEAAKWPIVTYFAFVADPVKHVFVKPSNVKKCAAALGFELLYDSMPNAITYDRMERMYYYLAEHLRTLGHEPITMLDVQTFWWLGGIKKIVPEEE